MRSWSYAWRLSDHENLRFSHGSQAAGCECLSPFEVPFCDKMTVDGGHARMRACAAPYLSEPLHGAFSSPERKIGVLRLILEMPIYVATIIVARVPQRRWVKAQFVP